MRDRQQFNDPEKQAERLGVSPASWGLFGVVWDSSQVLAHLVFDIDIQGLRILEVGCGIALASLVLNHRCANITATDQHPEAGNFLRENVKLNNGQAIPFIRTAWNDETSGLGQFDLIIGSDLLYEPDHVDHLSAFVARHSRPAGHIIIVDPGRTLHSRFRKKMIASGFKCEQVKAANTDYLALPFKGRIMHFER